MFVFFDLETTDKSPMGAEILTGFFEVVGDKKQTIDSLDLKIKPTLYKKESFEIHKISRDEAGSFPPKEDGLRRLASFIIKHKDMTWVCHANHQSFGSYGYFDWQVIKKEFHFFSDKAYYWFLNIERDIKKISTHTIAKRSMNLDNYRLGTIASHFNIVYDAHNAKSDVYAMKEIFFRLVPEGESMDYVYRTGNYQCTDTLGFLIQNE